MIFKVLIFKLIIYLEYEFGYKLKDIFWGNDGFFKEGILI